ncbi:MAG: thioredoxin family protein [Clostridia bacterium]|nr:thioredoxin family protein [Clostridia bacterium]
MNNFDFNSKVVIEFYGNGCLNCQLMEPIMREIKSALPDIHFSRINADTNLDLVQRYQITSLPTLLMLRNEQIVGKIVGVKSSSTLYHQINTTLNYA